MNMNKIKRTCALLLAVALILGVVMQSGIGGVLANNMDGTTEQTGTVSEQSEPVSEPVTMPVTEQITEPVTEPITEPVTEPAEEAVTEPTAALDDETQTTEPTADSDVTGEDGGDILPELSIYQQLMSCQSLAEMEVLLFSEENAVAVAMLTQEERGLISSRIEELAMLTGADDILKNKLLAKLNENTVMICPECGGIDGLHTEGCSAYVQVCTCGSLDGTHTEDCPAYLPVCTCGSLDGVHTEGCQLYVPICNCGSENGEHDETCPLYVPDATICGECGVEGGHDKTCPLYVEEYVWAEFTDWELAIWLMDEANAETVKAILSDETTEEYALLTLRIDAIMDGEDAVLAEQVIAYLTALMGMDGTDTLAEADEYIYFDLAAGSVTIGAKTYSGKIYVNGVAKDVNGTHDSTNKYYIYQSTEANRAYTGYADDDAYTYKTGCRVPVYKRVMYDGKPWTEYITNNTDVKAVSEAWETAAIAAGRTAVGKQEAVGSSSGNKIFFESSSNYSADVTIDNIWTYFQKPGPSRSEGGITAHFVANIDVNITIRLKGDNRLGNIHYGANRGTNNQIIFCNGDESDAPGSLTVADFPNNFGGNYWCSAIGGDDSRCDRSDGIVINSGVIYAGTTSKDDCTAIGGGGNEYGRVVISGGTVTAVSASTGTAIGGGIGWGNQGGDARVVINGGTVYAYNHGIGTDSGSYVSFVPAAAIGGGSASTNAGNKDTYVEINGGFVYAQSKGGVAIGGGGSGTQTGGKATVNISGGTVIAKSVGGEVNYDKKGVGKNHTETITPGVSIGGGTGATGGGSVELTISGENTILRTGSIGGGKTTGSGNTGSANVTITGGDITGQVIMAGGASSSCSFNMSGGIIHDTDVVNGNTITDIKDPQEGVPISYIEKNGGAVWMEDPKGVTEITGGTIEGCTAELGGAIYMTGGKFTLSGTGNISGNKATAEATSTDPETPAADTSVKGLGGAVYISGGIVNINGGCLGEEDNANMAVDGAGVYVNGGDVHVTDGKVQYNEASRDGGGVYVTGGSVDVSNKASISNNSAIVNGGGIYVTGNATVSGSVTVSGGIIDGNKAGKRGGGVYLPDGVFKMTGGTISNNYAEFRGGGIFLKRSPELTAGVITGNEAYGGGGLCINGDMLKLTSPDVQIYDNTATNGGGVSVLNGDFILDGGNVGVENQKPNHATNGGGVYVKVESDTSDSTAEGEAKAIIKKGNIWHNDATYGGGVYLAVGGSFTMEGEDAVISKNEATNGGGIYLYTSPVL